MLSYLLVGVGAAIGGVLRYSVSVALASRVSADGFPWHTFTVNAVGCLAAGVTVGVLSGKPESAQLHLLFVTGIMGGLTTFSAFGLETATLLKSGNYALASIYVVATLIAGLVGVAAGLRFS